MELCLTRAASKQMFKQKDENGYLKLVYDAEGCGCIMSGVTGLWLVQVLEDDDTEIRLTEDSQPSPWTIVHEKRHSLFFEERLILDYTPHTQHYKLFSNNQIYNMRISIIDKRGAKT